MLFTLEALESLYLSTLVKADINNPDHMAILKDLQERIHKARVGTRKIESIRSPTVYGDTSTGNVEAVITKGPAHNTISEKIEFPRAVTPRNKEMQTEGMTDESWAAWPTPRKPLEVSDPKSIFYDMVEEENEKRSKKSTAVEENDIGNRGLNGHTGPKFTREGVRAAIKAHVSLAEAGRALGMKNPKYIYQLIKKYGI